MKKKYKNFIYIFALLVMLMFIKFMLYEKDIFSVVISFSMFLIFVNSYSHINIEKEVNELRNNNYIYSQVRLFYLTILIVFLINLIYMGIIYIITLFLSDNYFLFNYNYILLIMGSTIFVIPTLNILSQYLKANNLKKFGSILKLMFYIIWGFLSIILLIVNYKIDISTYMFAIYIYLLEIFAFIVVILCCLLVIKNKKIFKLKQIKKREECKISLKNKLKNIFASNIKYSIKKVIYLSYYYVSIVFVFFILLYRYNYGYKEVISIMLDTYFYDFALILILVLYYILKYKKVISNTINNIKEKGIINNLLIDIANKVISVTILICILSGPILKLLFNSKNSIVFMFFIWILPFILLYIIGIKLLEVSSSKKVLYITLLTGILVKIVLTIPLINSFYRMGYNLIYGDIVANIIGMFVSYIMTILYLNKKYKIDFSNSFEKILNIVYENIILSLILIISSMVISLNVNSKSQALIVIIIYIVIYVIYNIIKNLLLKMRGVIK